MIDFIIIEDNISFLSSYKLIIDKIMMNYDTDYMISVFDKYSPIVKRLIKNNNFKIYIISYSSMKKSMEMIQYIREELDDWQSLMIIMNEEDQYNKLIDNNLFLLDIISKKKEYKEKLKRDIQIALKNYDKRPNTLKYCYKKIFYNIEYWKILFIVKEPDLKISRIRTLEKDYYIPGSISSLEKKLDNRFLKCNRSYIINLEQIESYNSKTNLITLKNNEILDAISRTKKKRIIHYMRGIDK